jgi:ArsR family transcriptional regulator
MTASSEGLTGTAAFDIFTFMETSKVLQALAALSQETRLAAYRLLVEHAPEGLFAGQIAERLGIPPPSLSFHLKELRRAGLIAPSQVSRFVWYRADLDAMNGLVAYLTENCCRSSAVCDPSCAPTRTKRAVAVAMPASKRRKSA